MTRVLFLSLSTLLLTHCASPDNQWAETARATGRIVDQ